jgi:hypothetical protein
VEVISFIFWVIYIHGNSPFAHRIRSWCFDVVEERKILSLPEIECRLSSLQ